MECTFLHPCLLFPFILHYPVVPLYLFLHVFLISFHQNEFIIVYNRRTETVAYLRRKLGSNKAKTVFLAVQLAETLVKNCGARVHASIGGDYNSSSSFMRQMVAVAKKYCGKSGAENVEVAELVLDVIQAWGEAFLVMSKQFPAFVGAYHDLRKDGLKFKPQYDSSRVPIFTQDTGIHNNINTTYFSLLKVLF